MKKRNISLSTIELLSAYLDGQLNARQQAALEARLHEQPAINTEFKALQNTRQMVRSLPRMRAPRNFTLSAQSYPRRIPSRLPALFGAVSALSSALLILLVIGSLLLGSPTARPVSMVVEESPAYPAVMKIVEEEDSALLMQESLPSETEPALSMAAPPSDDINRSAEPTSELLVTPAPTAEPLPTPSPALEENLAAGISESVEGIGDDATPTPDTSLIRSSLFTGELILAGITLLSGIAALILWIRLRK